MRVEPDNARRLSHKIRECVNVVKKQRAIAVVDDVLDTADVDPGGLNNSFDRVDHFSRRGVALNLQAIFWRVELL